MNEIAEVQDMEEISPRRTPTTKEELLERLLHERIGSKLEEIEKINNEHFEMMHQWENELDHLKAEGNQFEKWVRLKDEGRTKATYRNSYLSLKGLTKIGASNDFAKVNAFRLIDTPHQSIPDYGKPIASSNLAISTQGSHKVTQSMSIVKRPASPTRGGLIRNPSEANIAQKIGKIGAQTPKNNNVTSKALLLDMVNNVQNSRIKRPGSPVKSKNVRPEDALSQSVIISPTKSINATPARSKVVTPRGKLNKSVVVEEQAESRVPKKLTIPNHKLAGNKVSKQRDEPKSKPDTSDQGKPTKLPERTKSPDHRMPRQDSKKTLAINDKTAKTVEATKGKSETTKESTEPKKGLKDIKDAKISHNAKVQKLAEKPIEHSPEKIVEKIEKKPEETKYELNTVSTEESKHEGNPDKIESPHENNLKVQTEKVEEEKQLQKSTNDLAQEVANSDKPEEVTQPEPKKEEGKVAKKIEIDQAVEKLKQKIDSKSKDLETYIKEKSQQHEQKINTINGSNEALKQEGEIPTIEPTALKFSKTTLDIIDMVEDGWVDELIEKENTDKRVYVVLNMFLIIMRQESIPDINKDPQTFWKTASTFIKSEKDIRELLKKLQEIGNEIPIKDQILLEKLNNSGAAILETSTYDEIDAFIGCLSYLIKEICEYHGIQSADKKAGNKPHIRARMFKFNEKKSAYYQQKLEKLQKLANANAYDIK